MFIAAVLLILAGGVMIVFAPTTGLVGSVFIVIGVIVSRFLRKGRQQNMHSLTIAERRKRFPLVIIAAIAGCFASLLLLHWRYPEMKISMLVISSTVLLLFLIGQAYWYMFKKLR
jgi:hypothetical protein